jgi:hypothetical protein
MSKLGRKGGSVAFMVSYHGFIYTIFGLGPSHTGFTAQAEGKSLPGPAHGLEPTAQS